MIEKGGICHDEPLVPLTDGRGLYERDIGWLVNMPHSYSSTGETMLIYITVASRPPDGSAAR